MRNFILGICFGTVGITVLQTMSDIIINGVELARAKIAVKITKCNTQINEMGEPQIETKAIGFTTEDIEEDSI